LNQISEPFKPNLKSKPNTRKPMKLKTLLIPAFAITASLTLYGCGGDEHDHDHDDHDHDHAHAEGEGHDDDHDHEHGEEAKSDPGPNGGRLITTIEPHAEFLVTDDRKVQVTFLAEDNKTAVAPGDRSVTVTAGDRSNPTQLAFTANGNVLLSDGVLPDGDDFPTVVEFKLAPDAETVREKFNLNLSDCPTCDYREYACICGHGEGDH
jgi:hypothetical protein